jgi:hypothetical protein
MNKEIKARWLAALRSGEYEQGQGQLVSEEGHYCCLGVLCDLHSKDMGIAWKGGYNGAKAYYMGEDALLPTAVQEWAGLPDNTGANMRIDGTEAAREITALNDDGYTFTQLSELIEEQL